MADYIFDDWKKALDDFQKNVEKDLEEIHKQKADHNKKRPQADYQLRLR